MSRRVKKISTVFMGAFLIISLIQNGSPKMPSRVTPSTSVSVKSSEVRVGGDKEGIILLGIDLVSSLAR